MKKIILICLCLMPYMVFGSTALTITKTSETAVAIPYEANNTAGNYALNPSGDVFLLFKNTDLADSATVTITAQKTSFYVPGMGTMTKANATIALAATEEKMIGPLAAIPWNDANDRVQITFAGDASAAVEIAALRVRE